LLSKDRRTGKRRLIRLLAAFWIGAGTTLGGWSRVANYGGTTICAAWHDYDGTPKDVGGSAAGRVRSPTGRRKGTQACCATSTACDRRNATLRAARLPPAKGRGTTARARPVIRSAWGDLRPRSCHNLLALARFPRGATWETRLTRFRAWPRTSAGERGGEGPALFRSPGPLVGHSRGRCCSGAPTLLPPDVLVVRVREVAQTARNGRPGGWGYELVSTPP